MHKFTKSQTFWLVATLTVLVLLVLVFFASWRQHQATDATLAEGTASWQYDELTDSLREYDILQYLPVTTSGYQIGHGNCDFASTTSSTSAPETPESVAAPSASALQVNYASATEVPYAFCVVITADFGFRDAAIGYLQRTGVDLSAYRIEFLDYTSAFSTPTLPELPTLTISEDLSAEAATAILESEASAIITAANSYLSNLITGSYSAEVLQLKLYGLGGYCGLTVRVTTPAAGTLADTYRVLFAYLDGTWQPLTAPELLFSATAYPNLPASLLEAVNHL